MHIMLIDQTYIVSGYTKCWVSIHNPYMIQANLTLLTCILCTGWALRCSMCSHTPSFLKKVRVRVLRAHTRLLNFSGNCHGLSGPPSSKSIFRSRNLWLRPKGAATGEQSIKFCLIVETEKVTWLRLYLVV